MQSKSISPRHAAIYAEYRASLAISEPLFEAWNAASKAGTATVEDRIAITPAVDRTFDLWRAYQAVPLRSRLALEGAKCHYCGCTATGTEGAFGDPTCDMCN